jgi:hypothetical protein
VEIDLGIFTLKMEVILFSGTSTHKLTSPCYIPEDGITHKYRCENLRTYFKCFACCRLFNLVIIRVYLYIRAVQATEKLGARPYANVRNWALEKLVIA